MTARLGECGRGSAGGRNRRARCIVPLQRKENAETMITIFTTAKPFTGHSGVIQRNALKSWKELHADAEVILFGDEEGAAEAANELGVRHVASVQRRVEGGPKVLRSFFDVAQEMARHELICYVN